MKLIIEVPDEHREFVLDVLSKRCDYEAAICMQMARTEPRWRNDWLAKKDVWLAIEAACWP